jgi:hypothetical protein
MRAITYGVLGTLGLLLVAYLGERALFLSSQAEPFVGSIVVLVVASVSLTFAALANFAVAYAITVGRVSTVCGTPDGAELLNDEGELVVRARIRFVANLDRNDARKSADRQQVIFLAGVRPSSCMASAFRV